MIDIYLASFFMLIALFGAVRIVLCRHNEDDSFDERLLIVFLATFLAFTMVFKRVVLGSYVFFAFETAEEAVFVQFFIWLGAWFSSLILLVVGPMLFMDKDLNFTLKNPGWLNKASDDKVEQSHSMALLNTTRSNVISFNAFIKK